MTNGPALKALRERLGVEGTRLADELGVSATRVYTLEGRAALRESTASRYLAALRHVGEPRRDAVRELFDDEAS